MALKSQRSLILIQSQYNNKKGYKKCRTGKETKIQIWIGLAYLSQQAFSGVMWRY